MRHLFATVVVVLVLLVACKEKPAEPGATPAGSADPGGGGKPPDPAGSADPGAGKPADPAGSAADPWVGSAAPTDPAVDRAPDPVVSVITRLCERDAACGCPIENCETFFEQAALPSSVYECFVQQSCESLCAKDSGAPGSVLHDACMKGKVPAPSHPGTARKSCRAHADCPAKHECCGGACYQMGTSLWITACQMPSGKF